jgi:hypothetical protein
VSGRFVFSVLGAGIIILSGLVHGLRTDRWWVSDARQQLAARVPTLPAKVADWTSVDLPLDDWQLKIVEADAYLHRRYTRKIPGQEPAEVTLILLSGRAASLSVHTPDVCFGNSGYQMDGEPIAFMPETANGRDDSFWQARFRKPDESGDFRVYWAWCDGGKWLAAADARSEFAHRSALYKLYLVCPLSRDPAKLDPAQQLFTDLLPELHRCLTAP